MNRNSFLKGFFAVGTFLISPLTAISRPKKEDRIDKGVKVDSGKDRFDEPISLLEGDTFYTKVSSKDTDNDIYIFESTRVKKGGPREHVHFEQDEFWYILEGEFLFKVGERTFTAKTGDSVFGPRQVPHAFAKMNDGNARILIAFQPAGKMEELFKAISQGKFKNMTEEERDKYREAHGLKNVGPALIYEKGK
ncbi:MAG: cupin domain-containing protein [Cyclobacteriaceae bacterium]|jgi:mannose-6-phosphate isomerase-like protein (cupin superfamily)